MKRITTLQSGTSKPSNGKLVKPALLGYPGFIPFAKAPELSDLLCYVIRHYGSSGISVLVTRRPTRTDVDLNVVFGDWAGNKIDLAGGSSLAQTALRFAETHLVKFVEVMKLTQILQAQYFLAFAEDQELVLVDMQTAINKLSGPGMVRDIFGNIMRTQDVLKVEPLDERAQDAIKAGTGSYAGDLIIKPSRFRIVARDPQGMRPLYVEVRR